MDQLVALMMEEEKTEPSEQFIRILQGLDPTEVGNISFIKFNQCQLNIGSSNRIDIRIKTV